MKIGVSRKSWGFICAAVASASAYLASTTFCRAEASTSGVLAAHVTLTTSHTLSLGEPIVLHYEVSNNSTAEQLSFEGGPHHQGWYRLSVTNATRKRITAAMLKPSLDELNPQGLHQSPEISLLPGGSIEGDIVATQVLAITQPGDYVLTLRVPITYYLEPIGAWYPKGRPADQVPMTFTRNFDFPLKVTPADPKRLQATAETLSRELQDVKYAGQSKALLAALSSLPEAVALPSWQALVLDPAISPAVLSKAVELLGGLRSPGAADLLGQALFDRAPSVGADEDGVRASARKAVAEMYNLGDDQMKQRLEQVYAQHGASRNDLLEAVTTSNPN